MFTTTGSTGLYKAPLSKALLLIPSALSFLLAVVFPQYQDFFLYSLHNIRQDLQIWRLICGRLICLDLKDTFCSSLLIYNFRIFERRYGSRKFASFLFGAWILSALFDTLLAEALRCFSDLKVDVLPSGLLGPVFALFVPFYCSIPRVQVPQVFGPVPITNKSLVYIVGLQLLTSSSVMWINAVSGLVSGTLYCCNIFKMQHIIFVPRWIARCSSRVLEPLFKTPEPSHESMVGRGATVDIQRQQRMDLLDQQMLLSQFTQMRRNRQPRGGLINWNRFFPSLRHRRPANHPQQAGEEVSEEQADSRLGRHLP
uniref:UBA domain containing 2 n=1 Tax=Lepisosteus oculatus TaxID=7918 RepID=W5M5V6_LEPOC